MAVAVVAEEDVVVPVLAVDEVDAEGHAEEAAVVVAEAAISP